MAWEVKDPDAIEPEIGLKSPQRARGVPWLRVFQRSVEGSRLVWECSVVGGFPVRTWFVVARCSGILYRTTLDPDPLMLPVALQSVVRVNVPMSWVCMFSYVIQY